MTTTPGPRTAWLRTVIVEHATSFQGEADAVALVAEFEDRIRAEARADVDGLVALRDATQAFMDWQYRMPGARRFTLSDLRTALLAGDKAENWDDFEPLELLAGDKAEAPE